MSERVDTAMTGEQAAMYQIGEKSSEPDSNSNRETEHPAHESDAVAFVLEVPQSLVGHVFVVLAMNLILHGVEVERLKFGLFLDLIPRSPRGCHLWPRCKRSAD